MKFMTSLLLFSLCFVLFLIPAPSLSQNYNPSFFKLALQWPNSFCNIKQREKPGEQCKPPLPQRFTVHGMWPQDKDGNTLPRCNNGSPLDEEEMDQELKEYLNFVWPSHKKEANFMLWQHEWDSHVRCLKIGGKPVDAGSYFLAVCKLMKRIEQMNLIKGVFANKGLVPDDTKLYKPDDFLAAIYQLVKQKYVTQMECNSDKKSRKQVYEIYFCVGLDYNLKNCTFADPKSNAPPFNTASCDKKKKGVFFPDNYFRTSSAASATSSLKISREEL